jgi:hypothetical protein
MAAPTNPRAIGFPPQVTLPAGGGASASFDAGASFDITKPAVKMTISLPAGSNVTFGDGSKELPAVSRTYSSLGRQELKQPVTLAAAGGEDPDSPIAIMVRLNYDGESQTSRTDGQVTVKRASAAATVFAAGAAPTAGVAATAARARKAPKKKASARKKSPTRVKKAPRKLAAKKSLGRSPRPRNRK